jgi:hypothetical protein
MAYDSYFQWHTYIPAAGIYVYTCSRYLRYIVLRTYCNFHPTSVERGHLTCLLLQGRHWQQHMLHPLLLSLVLQLAVIETSSSPVLQLYVSSRLGNDGWDGLAPQHAGSASSRGPLATLERAAAVVEGAPASSRATIFVRDGVYRLAVPLVLSRSNVTISSFPGDALPVLSGARPLGQWQRMNPSPSSSSTIWVADWPGAANFSRIYSSAGVEFTRSRLPANPDASLHFLPLEPCTPVQGSRPVCPDANKLGFAFRPVDLPDSVLDAQPVTSLRVRVESAPFEESLHTVASINRTTHVLKFGEMDAFALGHCACLCVPACACVCVQWPLTEL